MNIYPYNNSCLSRLFAKGGIMFFSVERPGKLFKGAILLSAVENYCQRRLVHIKEYEYYTGKEEVR